MARWPLNSIFARDEIKHLADVVQQLTTMGACDLLTGSKTSLAPVMRDCGVPQEVLGAVAEWQAKCLEDTIWEDGVVKLLLGEVYGADWPIRTTRSVRDWLQG